MKAGDGKEIALDIRRLLDTHPWKETFSKLKKYAAHQLRFRKWHGIKGGPPPAGSQAEDFVVASIIKLYRGIRKWDPKKHPNLYFHLKNIIRSDINHYATSLENTRVCRGKNSNSSKENNKDPIGNYQCSQLRHDKKIIIQEYLEELRQYIAHDSDLVKIMTCLEQGITKSQDMANELKITDKQLANLKKRFRRQVRKFEAIIQGIQSNTQQKKVDDEQN